MNLGFIGLGIEGAPMAGLAGAGHTALVRALELPAAHPVAQA